MNAIVMAAKSHGILSAIENFAQHEILLKKFSKGMRIIVHGEVLSDRDLESLKGSRWLNDKVRLLNIFVMTYRCFSRSIVNLRYYLTDCLINIVRLLEVH